MVAPRSDILRRITQLYVFEHDGISPGILAGSELPPESFINDQLAKMGEPWRVRNIQGAVAESYDV